MAERIKFGLGMIVVGLAGAWLFWQWHKQTSDAPWYGISSGLTVLSGALAGLGLLSILGLGSKASDGSTKNREER